MRGGGRHKDKKSKAEKKQVVKQGPLSNKGPANLESEKDRAIQSVEEDERYQKIVEDVSEGRDVEVEQKMQFWIMKLQGWPGGDVMVCAIGWAVKARRKRRSEEQEQRRQEEQEQNTRQQQGPKVRLGAEEQLEATRAESTGEQVVINGVEEVRTGRGRAGLVLGERTDIGRDQQKRQRKRKRRQNRTVSAIQKQDTGTSRRLGAVTRVCPSFHSRFSLLCSFSRGSFSKSSFALTVRFCLDGSPMEVTECDWISQRDGAHALA